MSDTKRTSEGDKENKGANNSKKITMKYYRIHGADNNSSLYINNKELLEYCPKCGLIINRYEAVLSSIYKFVLKNKKYNFSFCLE